MTVPYGTADMKDIWCLLYIILQAPVSWKVLNLIVSQLDGEFHGYREGPHPCRANKSGQKQTKFTYPIKNSHKFSNNSKLMRHMLIRLDINT